MKTATRESWQHVPLPALRRELPVTGTYAAGEFARMQQGLIPQQMEDKWFIYWEEGILHFHRSWTGFEIYQIEFSVRESGEAILTKCLVNRDQSQYQSTDDENDTRLVGFLIDRLLLGKPVRFPTPGAVPPAEQPVYLHHIVGSGRSNGE
jgi:hypothetical protein